MNKLDKSIVCQLINASIEEEIEAKNDYLEILKVIPNDSEFKECSEAIEKILKDENKHSVILIKIAKKLECDNINITKDLL